MQLGWIRQNLDTSPSLSRQALRALLAKADEVELAQLWLPEIGLTHTCGLKAPTHLRLGLDLNAHRLPPPRQLAEDIRAAQAIFGDDTLVGLSVGAGAADRAALEQIETLLSRAACTILPTEFPMAPPLAQVLLQAAPGAEPPLRRGANAGFDVLSPAWQCSDELARHWAQIVAGATHARRRARPAQWHLARLIYVSEDQGAVDAFRDGPARAYLDLCGVAGTSAQMDDLIVAGPAREVAERLVKLRRIVGPFGTLHVLDPGLSPETAMCQMSRITAQVLPLIQGGMGAPNRKELETL